LPPAAKELINFSLIDIKSTHPANRHQTFTSAATCDGGNLAVSLITIFYVEK